MNERFRLTDMTILYWMSAREQTEETRTHNNRSRSKQSPSGKIRVPGQLPRPAMISEMAGVNENEYDTDDKDYGQGSPDESTDADRSGAPFCIIVGVITLT